MITMMKLKEYEEYHGFYDGYYLQKVINGTNITSDKEWYLINSLIQDVRIAKEGFASIDYYEKINNQLMENCDCEETINQIKKLADEKW